MTKQGKKVKQGGGYNRSVEGPLEDVTPDAAQASQEARAEAVEDLPKELSVQATIDWVGNDKARAQKALDAENSSGGPRRTLVNELERLVNEQTGAGVVSNEA